MKILINAITLNRSSCTPLLTKFNYWQSQGSQITIFGDEYLQKSDILAGSIEKFNYARLENGHIQQSDIKNIKSKTQFMGECLKRNLISLLYIKRLRNKHDWTYSPSSMLDLTLFPFFLKIVSKRTRWAVVFDNIVPRYDPGNKLIRFLAWFFFHLSINLIRQADKIFVISQDLERYLIGKGFKKDRIVLTTNGVENDLILSAKKDEHYSLDALFVGRINETKGIYDMLEVLKAVRIKYPSFQLGIMGDGDEVTKEQFKRKISEFGLEGNIQFLGYRIGQDKFNVIKSSKCFWFLSTSLHESFGIAMMEAVCSGLPAFCYDLAPFQQLYRRNEVIISKKHDWKAVSEKVLELFYSQNFENKEGEKLLGKYSWDKIAEIEYAAMEKL